MFELVPRHRGSGWGRAVVLLLLFFGGLTLFIGRYSGHPSFDGHDVSVPGMGTMSLWFAAVGGLALLAGVAGLLKAEVGRVIAAIACLLAIVVASDRAVSGMPAGLPFLEWLQRFATIAAPQILLALGILALAARHWPRADEPDDRLIEKELTD